MPRRYVATEKITDPWFRDLAPKLKCLWENLCLLCDWAGVIEPDWKGWSFNIGETVQESDLAAFGDRIMRLPCGKLWIVQFIPFQFPKGLDKSCRAHLKVFESIEKHQLDYNLACGLGKPIGKKSKVQQKGPEEDADKDKDKDNEREEGESEGERKFTPPDFDVATLPELPAEFEAPPPDEDFRVNPADDPVRQVLHAYHRLTTLTACGGMEAHEISATKAAIRRHCEANGGAQALVDEMVQRYAAAAAGKKPRSIKWFLQAWGDMGGNGKAAPRDMAAEAKAIREREEARRKSWKEQSA